MQEHEASRTLLKSPPELWAECSDAASLIRHLDQFGEIRITRLEPESTVAWEGERVSGMVRLEQAGWGTRVTLTVSAPDERWTPAEPEPGPEPKAGSDPEAEPEPQPDPAREPESEPRLVSVHVARPASVPVRRGGLWTWLRATAGRRPVAAGVGAPPAPPPQTRLEPQEQSGPQEQPEPQAQPEPEPRSVAPQANPVPGSDVQDVLTAALESLGQAHHRPFSRN